jgi:hypothetical protein
MSDPSLREAWKASLPGLEVRGFHPAIRFANRATRLDLRREEILLSQDWVRQNAEPSFVTSRVGPKGSTYKFFAVPSGLRRSPLPFGCAQGEQKAGATKAALQRARSSDKRTDTTVCPTGGGGCASATRLLPAPRLRSRRLRRRCWRRLRRKRRSAARRWRKSFCRPWAP